MGNQWRMAGQLMAHELTDPQKAIVHKKGLFVVKACPGSGKTLTVAARLHKLLTEWRQPHAGVAAMSFTNTAWQEVERYLSEDYGVPVPLGYPHFLGTIDSFINRFLFLPFGHKVMGCRTRPELTGPPYNDEEPIGHWLCWQNLECHRSGCRLNDFSYDEHGALTHLAAKSHFNQCQSKHRRCAQLKARFTTAGYATQADANYFALLLLERSAALAASLSRRFPTIIIDEAQDSSCIQMRIIELLIAAGITEAMLVGDPYQAIYEWRQAEPHLFENKFNEWQANSVRLSENWRSTQSICDVASTLVHAAERITAKNEAVMPYDHPPVVYGYNSDTELPGLLQSFRDHCTNRGIDQNGVCVLSRSREFINAIVPGTEPIAALSPWCDGDMLTRQVAYAKFLFDRGDFRGALRSLEVAGYKHLTSTSRYRREDVLEYARSKGFGKWRGFLYKLLCELPESKGTITAWLPGANRAATNNPLFQNARFQIKHDRRPHMHSTVRFEETFTIPALDNPTAIATRGTVHSVKGRSLDAVFLALKSKGATGPRYTNMLSTDLLHNEELRIVYVAITRARKALALAVPRASLPQWQAFLLPPT